MSLHKSRSNETVRILATIGGRTKREWMSSFGSEMVRFTGHAAEEAKLDPIDLLCVVFETALLTLKRDGLMDEAQKFILEINKIYDELEAERG